MHESLPRVELIQGDAVAVVAQLEPGSVDVIVTSPPYFKQRRYEGLNEIGWEDCPDGYASAIATVFARAMDAVAPHGSLWVVIGDSYVQKRLVGIPWLVANAISDAGWHLRSEIIWWKKGAMPESTPTRPSRDHETIFFFVKDAHAYWYDVFAAYQHRARTHERGNRANLRTVWEQPPARYGGSHFATFPPELAQRMVDISCPREVCDTCGHARRRVVSRRSIPRNELPQGHPDYRPQTYAAKKTSAGVHAGPGQRFLDIRHVDWTDCGHERFRPGVVLDPFVGSGATVAAAIATNRSALGIDSNGAYLAQARERVAEFPHLDA